MNGTHEPTFLDRLHAELEGHLSRSEREALAREIAADPARAALAESYRRVHALSAGALPPEADARTTFEDLAPRLEPARRLRGVSAAAALLLVAAASFFAGRRARPEPEPLRLGAIELEPAPAVATLGELSPDVPDAWRRYDPRGPLGVSFLSDVGEAEQLARAAGRPVLVFGFYPGCPLAGALDRQVFCDEDVVELVERTVPVRVDLTQIPDEEERAWTARGYPFLEVWRPDGTPAHALARTPDARAFLESLHDGLEKSDATSEQPAWSALHASVARFEAARTSELAGELATAERTYRELVEDAAAPEPLAARARAGLTRLADQARAQLLEACARAEQDPAAAAARLRAALERFAGTRFEADLRAVLERLERDGRCPPLVSASRRAA
jgi:hypothetical protein